MFFNEQVKEKRNYHRVSYHGTVHYEKQASPILGGSIACNISESGIKLKVGEFFPRKTTLKLRMKFNGILQIMCLQASVVWSEKISYSDQYYIGLEFIRTPSQLKKEIHSYINSPRF